MNLYLHLIPLFFIDIGYRLDKDYKDSDPEFQTELKDLTNLWFEFFELVKSKPHSFAPVRVKPERTYDAIDQTPMSEGNHTPMVLAKSRFGPSEDWMRLRDKLDQFGKSSGLFEDINVKALGKSESDPFQLMVKTGGPSRNLIDVGYGVSQALPVLVDLLTGKANRFYLMQQPEIHLHPRAQAHLGSFLTEFTRVSKSTLVVETHSDYLIDRVRSEVRRDVQLQPEDVSLLFFEKAGSSVSVHQIHLDSEGDLIDPPVSYGQFFLEEQDLFLGVK